MYLQIGASWLCVLIIDTIKFSLKKQEFHAMKINYVSTKNYTAIALSSRTGESTGVVVEETETTDGRDTSRTYGRSAIYRARFTAAASFF